MPDSKLIKEGRTVAAVGTFDGVHLGHKEVTGKMLEIAVAKGLQPLAITFDRHPLAVVDPSRAPKMISSLVDKKDLLEGLGIKTVILEFDEDLRKTTAAEWLLRLRDEFAVSCLVAGYDNTFGCDGIGMSLHDIMHLGEQTGIEVKEAPVLNGVSSSAIRKHIHAGEIEDANRMLGRIFSIKGKVIDGEKIGSSIDFPTANIAINEDVIVPDVGVYAGHVTLPDGVKKTAMINIGVAPTVKSLPVPLVEAHLIGWEGNIYNETVEVDFVKKIRQEIKFNNVAELRERLELDRKEVMEVLG